MSKKKYVLEEFRAIQNKIKDSENEYTSHFVIGIDQDENGFPESTMTMSSAKPLELIGMCSHLISLLTQIKKETIKKLQPYPKKNNFIDVAKPDDFEKMTDALPKPIADKIRDFKTRMDAAIESGDADEMKKLKDEVLAMRNPFKEINDELEEFKKKKDDEFDIEDFK